MEKIDLKSILANWSQNYKKALSVGREDRADVPGLFALKAMEEVWNLAVDKCKENAKTIEITTVDSNGHIYDYKVVDDNSIEQVKQMIT